MHVVPQSLEKPTHVVSLIRRPLLRELLRKVLCVLEELFLVPGVLLGQVGAQGVLRLWLVDQCYQRLYDLVRLGGRLPVLDADDGQAHLALLVDVGVVDLGAEQDLGGLEGVLCREVDLYPEGPFAVGGVLRDDEALPAEDVGVVHADVAEALHVRLADVLQLLLQSSRGCHFADFQRGHRWDSWAAKDIKYLVILKKILKNQTNNIVYQHGIQQLFLNEFFHIKKIYN